MGFRIGLIAMAILFAGVFATEAQRGGGGGGRGGGGGFGGGRGGRGGDQMDRMRDQMETIRAFPVDAMWVALSLGMDLSDDQLKILRVMMIDAWKKRQNYLELARKHGSWKDVKEEFDDLKKDLDKQVEAVLTKDQRKELKNSLKQQSRFSAFGR